MENTSIHPFEYFGSNATHRKITNLTPDAYITQHYPHWQKRARAVKERGQDADELLHHTIEYILRQPQEKIQGMIDRGELKSYVDGSLYMAATKRDSAFNRQFKNERNHVEISENTAVRQPFMGARLENETLDARISRLKPAQAELFRAYGLKDFDRKQYASDHSLTVKQINNELWKIKCYMKGIISREKKTIPDLEFIDGKLKMIADIEGKALYIGGQGSTHKECRMTATVEKMLRENHSVTDFDKWQTFHCTGEDKIFKDRVKKITIRL